MHAPSYLHVFFSVLGKSSSVVQQTIRSLGWFFAWNNDPIKPKRNLVKMANSKKTVHYISKMETRFTTYGWRSSAISFLQYLTNFLKYLKFREIKMGGIIPAESQITLVSPFIFFVCPLLSLSPFVLFSHFLLCVVSRPRVT